MRSRDGYQPLQSTATVSYAVANGRTPVLGHLPALLRHPFRFFESLQGQADVVRVDLGRLHTFFLTDPALVNNLLTDREQVLDKGRFYDKVRPLAGNGVVLANGEEHARQLAMIRPAFHHEQLRPYAAVMLDVARTTVGAWHAGMKIPADKEMHAITLQILARTMFGAGVEREAVAELVRLLPGVLKGIMVRTILPDGVNRLPLPMNHRFDAAFAALRRAISRVMRAYRDAAIDNGDMMSMLLAARDPQTGDPLSDKEVCDQIVAVTMAGSETAATALAWTFYELARHPSVERLLADEVATVLGDREFEIGDQTRLTYTRRVLQEALRLRQPILVISRRARCDTQLRSLSIPAGSELFYSPYGLHRDPRHFPEPHRFDPDRWLVTPAGTLPRGAYVPFGGGPRHCIGEQFAWVMMAVVVVEVIRRWRLRLPPGFRVREMPWATVNPRSLPMTVHPAAAVVPAVHP
jgi:cytochrome P450